MNCNNPRCRQPLTPAEQAAYAGRCEECYAGDQRNAYHRENDRPALTKPASPKSTALLWRRFHGGKK